MSGFITRRNRSHVGGVVGELPILVHGGLGDGHGRPGQHRGEGELPVHVVPDPGLGLPDGGAALLTAGLGVGPESAWKGNGSQRSLLKCSTM